MSQCLERHFLHLGMPAGRTEIPEFAELQTTESASETQMIQICLIGVVDMHLAIAKRADAIGFLLFEISTYKVRVSP